MSKFSSKLRGGFTLIELMIVVAIIGILAAIAIPNFVRFQLRSKSSEGKTNLAAIRTAEESYFAEYGNYIVTSISPATLNNPPSTKQAFVDTGAAGANFDTIGWKPEGQVYFIYGVNVTGTDYGADATADIDFDGTNQLWGYARSLAAVPVLVAGPNGCPAVWDSVAATPSLANQVGPCDGVSGMSVF
jgi:type IV pilus assembly protein PilA